MYIDAEDYCKQNIDSIVRLVQDKYTKHEVELIGKPEIEGNKFRSFVIFHEQAIV